MADYSSLWVLWRMPPKVSFVGLLCFILLYGQYYGLAIRYDGLYYLFRLCLLAWTFVLHKRSEILESLYRIVYFLGSEIWCLWKQGGLVFGCIAIMWQILICIGSLMHFYLLIFSPFSLITDSICLHLFAGMATPMSGRSLQIFLTIFHWLHWLVNLLTGAVK